MNPSVNHFRTPEERRILELAYYGEFFANLEFDDGYRNVLYKLLLNYIADNQSVTDLSLRIAEDTNKRVRVLLELTAPNPVSLPAITQITTQLQRDYMMQPIRQSYPYNLRSDIVLPLILAAPPEQSPHHARYLIQQAESTIISLERQLIEASHRVAILSSSDDIVMGALRTQTEHLISQLDDQIARAKSELSSLIATKYLELAQTLTSDTQSTIISPWQADTIIDIGAGGDGEVVSPRMLAWLEQGEQQYQKQNKVLQGMVSDFMTQIASLTESISQAQGVEVFHTTGILSTKFQLSESESDETREFITLGSLTGKKSNIVWNGSQLRGFSLPGVDQVYHITPIRKFGGNIETFWHRDRDGMIQYWYLEDGSYHLLDIAGYTLFQKIKFYTGTHDKEVQYESLKRDKIISGKFQLADNQWREFITIDNKFEILVIGGTDSFSDISKATYGLDEISTARVYRNSDNQLYQCVTTNKEGARHILTIEGISSFYGIKTDDTLLNGRMKHIGWTVNHDHKEKSYIIAKEPQQVLSIEGVFRFHEISIWSFQGSTPLDGEVTLSEGGKRYFYMEGNMYRFLKTPDGTEFESIVIKKKDIDGPPCCYVIITKTGGKKCYSKNQKGGYSLLQYDSSTEFKEIYIEHIDSYNKPYISSLVLLDGTKVKHSRWNSNKFSLLEILEKG